MGECHVGQSSRRFCQSHGMARCPRSIHHPQFRTTAEYFECAHCCCGTLDLRDQSGRQRKSAEGDVFGLRRTTGARRLTEGRPGSLNSNPPTKPHPSAPPIRKCPDAQACSPSPASCTGIGWARCGPEVLCPLYFFGFLLPNRLERGDLPSSACCWTLSWPRMECQPM